MWQKKFAVALVGSAAVVAVALAWSQHEASRAPTGTAPPPTSEGRRPAWEVESRSMPGLGAELVPGDGVEVADNGEWHFREKAFAFSVTVTAPDDMSTVHGVGVRLAIPRHVMEMTGYADNGWTCLDVPVGVECNRGGAVAPNEPWPALEVTARRMANAGGGTPDPRGSVETVFADVFWPAVTTAGVTVVFDAEG